MIFRALWSKTPKKGSFSKPFPGFRFWTFINVHFSKPKILLEKKLLRKINQINKFFNCDDTIITKYFIAFYIVFSV